jgi:uncharacterized membrane protein YbaN (DUF454 family)
MIVKRLLVVLGSVFLAVGVIGIFVPLLPTTPFLLLASACYLRGSERMHRWLTGHGRLGAYIRAFEEGRGIPLRGKVLAMATMWPSLAYAAWVVPWPALGVFLLASGAAVTLWMLRMPTARELE